MGPSGSGKSTLWKILRLALTKLGQSVKQYVMNPKAMPRTQVIIDPIALKFDWPFILIHMYTYTYVCMYICIHISILIGYLAIHIFSFYAYTLAKNVGIENCGNHVVFLMGGV